MNAQTVVDTFAPFVGTEGLPGVVAIYRSIMDDRVVVVTEDSRFPRIHYSDIAHGFLLSKLAGALAERGVSVWRSHTTGKWVNQASDYSSAVLAAASFEWPAKPEGYPTPKPMQAVINGVRYTPADDGDAR